MTRTEALVLVVALALAGCFSATPTAQNEPPPPAAAPFRPHVIVAIPDSGINPYHHIYYRSNLTEHPCTYIQNMPCDLQALNLSVGLDNWTAAFEQDREIWRSVQVGGWYWIPRTVFVAVHCEAPYVPSRGEICILDDSEPHGTGTTSSVLTENPDALIAFKEGGSGIEPFLAKKIPVDIFSVSWGYVVPIPVSYGLTYRTVSSLYVKGAGNDPRSTLMDAWSGNPNVISAGGAYAHGNREELMAAKQPEVVSYYCRPTAETRSVSEYRPSYCGTSFAAPTVAGALSRVILESRNRTGYTGGVEGAFFDPVAGLTIHDLRAALNRTASYDPRPKYSDTSFAPIPRNNAQPWLQWGWGFYDGWVADATIAHLLDGQTAPEKPAQARQHMDNLHSLKRALHGGGPVASS